MSRIMSVIQQGLNKFFPAHISPSFPLEAGTTPSTTLLLYILEILGKPVIFKSFLLSFYYSISSFPPLTSSAHPTSTPTVNPHTVVHVCGSFIHVLCLVPSPSFHHYSPPLSLLVTFSLFHVSMPVVLFCSVVSFVHQISLIGCWEPSCLFSGTMASLMDKRSHGQC